MYCIWVTNILVSPLNLVIYISSVEVASPLLLKHTSSDTIHCTANAIRIEYDIMSQLTGSFIDILSDPPKYLKRTHTYIYTSCWDS